MFLNFSAVRLAQNQTILESYHPKGKEEEEGGGVGVMNVP